MTKYHNEHLQRAFAIACGLPIKLQQSGTTDAALKPPVVANGDAPPPATAGGASFSHDRWVHDIAWECWVNSDFDIELAANLAAKETEDEGEYREICGALHDIERASDAEGYEGGD